MKYCVVVFVMLFSFQLNAQTATKDQAFKDLVAIFNDRPFVVNGAIYKLYDLELKGCVLKYKIHFVDQDDKKNKISTHRAYTMDLSKMSTPYSKTLLDRTSWLVVPAKEGSAIQEQILAEPKKGAISKAVINKNISKAFLPIEFNVPKYEMVMGQLLRSCK